MATQMMMTVHEQRVCRIAQEYEQRGYEVTVEPSSEQLPDFMSEFRPDILARSNGVGVVVEVPSSRRVSENKKWDELAHVVHEHPGWRFDLVPFDERLNQEPSFYAETISRPAIDKYLADSETLAASGATAPAMLMAWAALEAALRLAMQTDDIPIRDARPTAVISTAYSNGWLDREDYDDLMNLYRKYTAIAHGYQSDVQIADVERVRVVTANVLEEAEI